MPILFNLIKPAPATMPTWLKLMDGHLRALMSIMRMHKRMVSLSAIRTWREILRKTSQ